MPVHAVLTTVSDEPGILFGLTKVHLHDYLLATSLAILPGTVVYAFIGATGRSLIGGASTLEWSLLGLGLVATVLLSALIGHIAKKRLGIDR